MSVANQQQRIVYLSGTMVPESEAKISIFDSAVMLGDSLTAGLGIPIADAYPALLQRRVDAERARQREIAHEREQPFAVAPGFAILKALERAGETAPDGREAERQDRERGEHPAREQCHEMSLVETARERADSLAIVRGGGSGSRAAR